MNHNPELIVMVGLPGSGKDYWIEKYIAQSEKKYHIASSDQYIEAAAAKRGKTYTEVFESEVKSATTRMNLEVAKAIKNRENVIWNQTNMAATKRKKILSQFPKDYIKTVVVVNVDEDVHYCRLNNRARLTGKSISQGIIKNMRDSYVVPTLEEGFDFIIELDNN